MGIERPMKKRRLSPFDGAIYGKEQMAPSEIKRHPHMRTISGKPSPSISLAKSPKVYRERCVTRTIISSHGCTSGETGQACSSNERKGQQSPCDMFSPSANKRIFSYFPSKKNSFDPSNEVSILQSLKQKSNPPRRILREIPASPEYFLNCDGIIDDFYLNLLDWSTSNIITTASGSTLLSFNGSFSRVHSTVDLEQYISSDGYISSIQWNKSSNLAIGCSEGSVILWDPHSLSPKDFLKHHGERVTSVSWRDNTCIASAAIDHISISDSRDFRSVNFLSGHHQEVCGLSWSPDRKYLASGGNDNLVLVWDSRKLNLPLVFEGHDSAVKAVAWCPFESNLLATGGGSADRTIRLWDISNPSSTQKTIDAYSQVCSLIWNERERELLSAHGFSQNHLSLWSFPSMKRTVSFAIHPTRILKAVGSPNGSSVCTLSAEGALKVWRVFRTIQRKNRLSTVCQSLNIH